MIKNIQRLRGNSFLLAASLIWGVAFVAQRYGMEFIGPLAFNGIRFLLGALTLVPVLLFWGPKFSFKYLFRKQILIHGTMAGMALFFASSFQQVGMIYTSAGKAGFITSLYVLFVPAFGLLRRQPSGLSVWVGAILATIGMYLLSVHENLQMGMGDLLVLISAIFWAMHLIVLSYIAPQHDFRALAFMQFFICGIFSLGLSLYFENTEIQHINNALIPILYAGVISAGIGFTLQIAGQRQARADHAALILSLEAVFAAIGGYFLLQEKMDLISIIGCSLMLAGVVLSQMEWKKLRRKITN